MSCLCPQCKATPGDVIDSRLKPNGEIRRRRRCPSCNVQWVTWEASDLITAAKLKRERSRAKQEVVESLQAFLYQEKIP